MDLKDKRSLGEEIDSSGSSPPTPSQTKSCSDCQTTRTPLWRGGPAGPKSLCNACGIKYNKKRRAHLGLDRGGRTEKKKKLVKRWVGNMDGGMVLQQRLVKVWRSSKLGEEEQAAILLMALSCGSLCP